MQRLPGQAKHTCTLCSLRGGGERWICKVQRLVEEAQLRKTKHLTHTCMAAFQLEQCSISFLLQLDRWADVPGVICLCSGVHGSPRMAMADIKWDAAQ